MSKPADFNAFREAKQAEDDSRKLLESMRRGRGGGGPDDPGAIERRLNHLEADVREIKDVLRRLEPAIARMIEIGEQTAARVEGLEKKAETFDRKIDGLDAKATSTDYRTILTDGKISGLEGRMNGVEGMIRQLPTLWSLAALIFAIFGAAFVLLRFATPH